VFFPLGDDNSDRRIQPVVNYVLIGGFIAGLILVKLFLPGKNSGRRLAFS
jgi:hypothetical protein